MTALTTNRLQLAEHYCTAYAATLLANQTLDDALQPGFWAHVATKLRQHDTIRIIPEEGDFYALLIVMSAGRTFAKVKLLQHIPLDDDGAEDADLPSELSVKWKGPHLKYAVIRNADHSILKDSFVVKTEAEQWARDHIAAMSR